MKHVSIIGSEIPVIKSELNYIDFNSKTSLSDTDILVFDPSYCIAPKNTGIRIARHLSFEEEMNRYTDFQFHWKSEIIHFLNQGGILIVLLSEKTNSAITSNYYSLPIHLAGIGNARGENIIVVDSKFKFLHSSIKEVMSYEVFLNLEISVSFMTPKGDRVVGGYFHDKGGIVILLPQINFHREEYYATKDEEGDWNNRGKKLGQAFIDEIIKISKQLKSGSDKTPPPEWVQSSLFKLKEAEETKTKIKSNADKIKKLEKDNVSLHVKLEDQEVLKGLLYETGTPLEESVREALRILGYQAEGYDNGELELDQVITSPEGHRFIGECEGRDTKPIAIVKLNQLLRAIQDDFARDDIRLEEKAHGLLIGNPFRLVNPTERTESPFTDKCLATAEHSKVGLLTTVDLFHVARYIQENKNMEFAKKCREAINDQLGGIIHFPDIPQE